MRKKLGKQLRLLAAAVFAASSMAVLHAQITPVGDGGGGVVTPQEIPWVITFPPEPDEDEPYKMSMF